MSTTLSYGWIKPQTGDRGSTFFPQLEANIQKDNDHTHNGTNSAFLSPSAFSVTGFTSTIASGSWAAVSGKSGLYEQTVTVPAAVTEVNNYDIHIYNSSGHRLDLTIERQSATTYKVYINDNSLTLTAVYK